MPHYIVPDSIVGLTSQNSMRRTLTFIACPKCTQDFEVRDGKWIVALLPSGFTIKLKVCDTCGTTELKADPHAQTTRTQTAP